MEFLLGLFGLAIVLIPLALAIFNTTRVNALMRRVQQLELSVLHMRNQLQEIVKPPESTRKPAAPTVSVPEPDAIVETKEQELSTTPVNPAPPPVKTPVSEPRMHIPLPKSRTNKEWEALIGGKVLNRIGALALIIGVGFFLKYAFDNDWISESVRVLMGGGAGAALLLGADRAKRKGFEVFAQGLVGAGISILYLSVYAAFNFYNLVPQSIAFVLMSGVTMLTLWLSLRYDSLAVALLGWAGGFLTPFMLSTGTPNQIGLFTYIALLDAVLLAIVLSKQKWIVLEPLALLGTSLLFSFWFVDLYTITAFLPTLFFLIVLWALFFVVEAIRIARWNGTYLLVRHLLAAVVATLVLSGMYALMDQTYQSLSGLSIAILSLPYFAIFIPWKERMQSLPARNLLLAVGFVFTATAIQFTGFMTVTIWAVEAAIVLLFGTKVLRMREVWLAALMMTGVALCKLVFSYGTWSYEPLEEFRLLLNMRTAAFVAVCAVLYLAAEMLRASEDSLAKRFHELAGYLAALTGFLLVSIETGDFYGRKLLFAEGDARHALEYQSSLAWACVWIAYAMFLLVVGEKRRIRAFRFSSLPPAVLAFFVAVFAGYSFSPIGWFTPIINFRAGALALVGMGMGGMMYMWAHEANQSEGWVRVIRSAMGLGLVAVTLVLLTGETRDYFGRQIYELSLLQWTRDIEFQTQQLENMRQILVSAVWLASSIGLMALGLWRRVRNIRLVAIGLFGFTILKIFIYDLSFLQTLYRIFSFIGLGLILLGVSFIYQKYKGVILDDGDAPVNDAKQGAR